VIPGLLQLLVFQGLGELLARFAVPAVPGPVLGLLLLLAWLRLGAPLGARVGAGLDEVAAAFTRHLGLLFVPAAVGVVMFLPQLREHALGIAVALVASVVATLAASAWLLRVLAPDEPAAPDAGDEPGAGPPA
jgi:putative effector of murein hydrolase LrgA (UPF0299 family)